MQFIVMHLKGPNLDLIRHENVNIPGMQNLIQYESISVGRNWHGNNYLICSNLVHEKLVNSHINRIKH